LRNSVTWERFLGIDEYAVESYADAKELVCHVEGGTDIIRTADATQVKPHEWLYFDARNPDVKLFTTRDYFTTHGVAGGKRVQPRTIENLYGPAGDAWCVVVML
jgi:hypothetical protein